MFKRRLFAVLGLSLLLLLLLTCVPPGHQLGRLRDCLLSHKAYVPMSYTLLQQSVDVLQPSGLKTHLVFFYATKIWCHIKSAAAVSRWRREELSCIEWGIVSIGPIALVVDRWSLSPFCLHLPLSLHFVMVSLSSLSSACPSHWFNSIYKYTITISLCISTLAFPAPAPSHSFPNWKLHCRKKQSKAEVISGWNLIRKTKQFDLICSFYDFFLLIH